MTHPTYFARNRCQIREAAKPTIDSGLVNHETSLDVDLPRCGTPIRDWHGHQMTAVLIGEGEVSCQLCAVRSSNSKVKGRG